MGSGNHVCPLHDCWKNLAFAATGKTDVDLAGFLGLSNIKLWSIEAFGDLICEIGFGGIRLNCVGRVPVLAKSMIVIA